MVTGGAGFLGKYVVEQLERKGADVIVPLEDEYDLTQQGAIKRAYDDAKPDITYIKNSDTVASTEMTVLISRQVYFSL